MVLSPQAADPQAAPQDDAAFYRGVLHELIEIGADLARMVHAQAQASAQADVNVRSGTETTQPTADLVPATIAFDRIARTIRRTIALARRLDEPVPAGAEAGLRRRAARRQIIRAVEDTIQREAPGERGERLEAEFRERLDGPDIDDDIGHRPVAAIIADICADLGLGALPGMQAWKRRTPADIAALCARAAQDRPAATQAGSDAPPPATMAASAGLASGTARTATRVAGPGGGPAADDAKWADRARRAAWPAAG